MACFCVGPPGNCMCRRREKFLDSGFWDSPWPDIWHIPIWDPAKEIEKLKASEAWREYIDNLGVEVEAEQYYFWLGEEAETVTRPNG